MTSAHGRALPGLRSRTARRRLSLAVCVWVLSAWAGPMLAQPPAPLPAVPGADTPAPQPSPADQATRGPSRSPFTTTGNTPTSTFYRGNTTVAGRSRIKMAPNMIGDLFGTTGEPIFVSFLQTRALPKLATAAANGIDGFAGIDINGTNANLNGLLFGFPQQETAGFPKPEYDNLVQVDNLPDGNVIAPGPFTARLEKQLVTPPTQIPDLAPTVYAIFGEQVELHVGSPASGGVVGRSKLAENGSPIPRDRVFMNYSLFEGVPFTPAGITVHRFTPGFEKTFLDGRASWELRAPFASTLNSDILDDGSSNGGDAEFGNLTNYLKFLLSVNDTWAHAAGIGFSAPTANDIRIVTANGGTLLQIRNDAFHVLPFVGSLWTPNDRAFFQSFFQLDIDANGNRAELGAVDPTTNTLTGELEGIGRVTDATFFYGSISGGYWLYRDDTATKLINGIAPMVELHYNRSLNDEDVVVGSATGTGVYQIGIGNNNLELLNLALGVTARVGRGGTVSAAYVTPLGGGNDQQFDGEFRLFANWYFGQ